MSSRRGISLLLVWGSFYQQLAWAPILVVLATLAGDPQILAVAASAYSLANMFGNLSFGVLADRYGRLWIAGLGFLAMAATTALHIAASTPALLVVIRLLQGLAAAAVAPAAFAALAEGIPPERRAETMARAGLLIALASMMAPPVTGIVESRFGIGAAVWSMAAGLLVIALAALSAARAGARGAGSPGAASSAQSATAHAPKRVQGAPEAPEAQDARAPQDAPAPQEASAPEGAQPSRGRARSGAAQPGAALKGAFDRRLIAASALAGFAVMFAQNVLFYAFPLKGDRLGLETSILGAMFSAFAVGAVVAFVPPLSRVADRYGRRLPLACGLLLASAGLTTLGLSDSLPGIAAGMLVYGLGFGMIFPAVSALNADGASPERRGAAFGMLTAAFSFGAIVGPLATQALESVLSPFVTSALLVLAAAAAVSPLVARKRQVQLSM